MTSKRVFVALCLLLLGSGTVSSFEETDIDFGRGPVSVFAPDAEIPFGAMPLILLLHGRGATGAQIEGYLQFLPRVDEIGFVYAHPDGMVDSEGFGFWNATPVCCDFDDSGVDDSGYLRAMIDELSRRYPIDPARVFVFGHSNGGFMAYRMACDHSGVVTGIVSIGGASFLDHADCHATAPVHVLQVHGSNDQGLLYDGGCFDIGGGCYPGALEMVAMWTEHNQCPAEPEPSPHPLDISDIYPGEETTIIRHRSGCAPGGSVELWTVHGAGHTPVYNENFAPAVLDLFLGLTHTPPEPRTATGRAGP